jgi:two-component system chemotaxis response regulator CheB
MGSVVAIGASQGGVEALRKIAAGLPARFPAPVMVILHTGAEPSILPSILMEAGPLPALHARHGEALEPGRIYVAPPDRHLIAVDGRLELSHGPRENWARPAIDPTFRSLAEAFGREAIGVVLTGLLNDGTSGLYEIKRRGGVALVQDPATAEAPSMPRSAIDNVEIDFCLPLEEMAGQLVRLVARRSEREHRSESVTKEATVLSHPVAQTCPECGGAMLQEMLGTLTRFRCHIGHVMTAEVLAAAQREALEKDLSAVLRFLNERVELCREMAKKHLAKGNDEAARLWERAAEEAARAEPAAKELAQVNWLRPEQG